MKTLKFAIFFEIGGSFLLGLLVFSTILLTNEITRRLFETLVQESLTFNEVGMLFICILPNIFLFSIPMATLLSILVCFGRLSADNEITAIRSSGISIRRLLIPVLLFAIPIGLIAFLNSNFVLPNSNHYLSGVMNQVAFKSLNSALQVGVFEERFPKRVLYIKDSSPNKRTWNGIFHADLSNSEKPIITLAKRGHLINDFQNKKLILNLSHGASYETVPQAKGAVRVISFDRTTMPLYAMEKPSVPKEPNKKLSEIDSLKLYSSLYSGITNGEKGNTSLRKVSIEFHRRLALSGVVIVFAMLGLPLGVVTRQGGKSLGFIISLGIFLGYFILFSQGLSLAEAGQIPSYLGPWLANIASLIFGCFLLYYADKRRSTGVLSVLFSKLLRLCKVEKINTTVIKTKKPTDTPKFFGRRRRIRSSIPTILDLYLIKGFLNIFLLVVTSFLLIFIVFTFFELLSDIIKHSIEPLIVLNYFLFLIPHMLIVMVPFSVLVAILVQFSLLTRTSQIDAMKSSGISLYRVSSTIFLLALLISMFLFGLQEYVSPVANQKQDDLRRMIKGRSPQTKRPVKQWMLGEKDRIFHYNFFDDNKNVFSQISLFNLEENSFSLKQLVFAENAYWDNVSMGWIFENGWSQGFKNGKPVSNQFELIKSKPIVDITEKPIYFKKEVRSSSQMSYFDLKSYIGDLKQSGFNVVRLSVALHRKLSFPLVALTMAMIAIPFALSTGRRGSLYGVGLSVLIGISYWVLQGFFEQLGSAGRLEPFLAAWAPNLIFGGGGIYLLFNIRT